MKALADRQAFPHSVQTANGRITDIEGGITVRQYMACQFMSVLLEAMDDLIAELEGGDR